MSTTDFSQTPGTPPSGSADGAPEDSSGAKDQAKQAAGTAADQGKHVAGVARDEAKNVVSEAQNQLRGLLDEATTQVDEQSKAQKSRLADTVRTFGDDLESMRGDGQNDGVAAQVVQQVAGQARSLAAHLDDREPSELLDDVRRFASRRPEGSNPPSPAWVAAAHTSRQVSHPRTTWRSPTRMPTWLALPAGPMSAVGASRCPRPASRARTASGHDRQPPHHGPGPRLARGGRELLLHALDQVARRDRR